LARHNLAGQWSPSPENERSEFRGRAGEGAKTDKRICKSFVSQPASDLRPQISDLRHCVICVLFSEQSNGRRARADTDENLQANLARAAKTVKREDVMRDDLTFYV